MLVNKRRKRRSRRRMPVALARYWASRRSNPHPPRRRRRRGSPVRVRHVYANPRRRTRRRSGGGVPSTVGGFLSMRFLTDMGFGALGAVTPSVFTDRVLPMVGVVPTGIFRRIIQLAVPTVVLMVGGRRLLGGGAHAFAIGAYAVTGIGLLNDLTGGLVTFSGVGRPSLAGAPGMGRYQLAPQGITGFGRYDRSTALLMGGR